VIWT